MSCWASLKRDSEFYNLFPNGRVQILSIVPVIPREEGCPPCYLVLGNRLTPQQLEQLAQLLQRWWPHECQSLEQAKEYILRENLPLKTSHFDNVSTDDIFYIPNGVALNAAINFRYVHGNE